MGNANIDILNQLKNTKLDEKRKKTPSTNSSKKKKTKILTYEKVRDYLIKNKDRKILKTFIRLLYGKNQKALDKLDLAKTNEFRGPLINAFIEMFYDFKGDGF